MSPLIPPPNRTAPPPGSRPLPPVEVARGGAAVAADVARLAELQVRLFAADWRSASGRAVGGAVGLVAGLLAAVLCVPVLVAAVGLALAAAGLPVWAGLLIAGTVSVAAGALAAWLGWRRLTKAAAAFDRSRAAAADNVAWVKRSLAREPHPPAPAPVRPPAVPRPEPAATNGRPR